MRHHYYFLIYNVHILTSFHYSAIIPKKRLMRRVLNCQEIERNVRIGSDRVPVENFFGRLGHLFRVFSNKYRWSRDKFGLIVDFCLSLTNYHIRLHPLRERDIEYYKLIVADLRKKTEDAKNSNRKRQLKHRQRRIR